MDSAHEWKRDYGEVDASCAYCKRCNIWYAEYLMQDYPSCTYSVGQQK